MTDSAAIALAIVLAVLASFAYAFGIAWQHRSVDASNDGSETVGLKKFLALLTNPQWLLGLAGIGVSAVGHLIAVSLAPVTVVQPIGILAVVWAVLISRRVYGTPIPRRTWLFVALTVGGLTAFTVLSSMHANTATVIDPSRILPVAGTMYVLAGILCLVGWRGPHWIRCMAWAAAAACLYGQATGLIKVGLTSLQRGEGITSPWIWGTVLALIVPYALGAWIVQQAYATGAAEIAVGTMTTIDPICAVIFGMLALGEGEGVGPLTLLGMAAFGLIAAVGVALLSRYHPDTLARQEKRALAAETV
ncbi:DMT family protein [Parenemella sanctibonifatiensis]|uniref:DMT family transporter n=1 Tax=Parenemella sanctibonifatiensis TaxID=2016505 RepID=A0A255EG56_9ACTN|nr:hypothetical protein [Parenemella sanctibonifatiensis]OYN90506.1 hypothetical protein CGZ92_01360 [Parenemella sanctibonifatiensis]